MNYSAKARTVPIADKNKTGRINMNQKRTIRAGFAGVASLASFTGETDTRAMGGFPCAGRSASGISAKGAHIVAGALAVWFLMIFAAGVRADVRFGVDARSPRQVSFLQINAATHDAAVTTVADGGMRGLGRPTGAFVYLGSGTNQGSWLRITLPRSGLISSLMAPDKSRIDLHWDKTKGYQ